MAHLVPAMSVYDALGLAGRARRVERKEWEGRIQRRRRDERPQLRDEVEPLAHPRQA